MSFILDALKKSETDRQRQNGPALFEVRVAPTRDKLPLWAVGLGVLLAVNLVIVAWVLLHRPAAPEVVSPPVTAVQPTPPPSYPAPAVPPAPNTVPVSGAPPTAPVAQTAGMTQPPPSTEALQAAGSTPPQMGASTQPPQGAATAPVAGTEQQGDNKVNPDDYAPATDPQPQPFGNHVSRGTVSGVPLYADIASTNHLPTLRLDLHVYAANPQERFVMINMHKLHEGDALPTEGVRVESITPYGAVLSHDGTKFVLPRD